MIPSNLSSLLLGIILTVTSTHVLSHFTGGFSIESVNNVADAANDGIQIDLKYGFPYSPTNPIGQVLQAHNMKMIDSMPWDYLYYYECQLHKTCTNIFPELTSEQALLTDVTNHLQQAKNNPLIVGYWVLDDWNFGAGTGQSLLVQINNLIHQITPGRPSICGFGTGGIYPAPSYNFSWSDGTAANFSPQGCDMVDFYIYGASGTSGTYDWTMSKVLTAMFASLKNRGWDINKEPLVGTPQAFGGAVEGELWPVPTAQSVETQAKSFCQNGATGIIYYAWGQNPGQDPSNNAGIAQGIKNGNADCNAIWNTNSLSPTVTFSISLCPHGIGNCGDNANSNSSGNTSPSHTSRNVTITVLSTNSNQIASAKGIVTYNRASQNYQGIISVPNLSTGQYLISIKMEGFLGKQIPGIVSVIQGQTTSLPLVYLTSGDINNDNQLDIQDYNILISCFGSKFNTLSCLAPVTSQSPGADIDDDGTVSGVDYNLFLRELSVQSGG